MDKTVTGGDKLAKAASPNLVPPEFTVIGNNRFDELLAAQTRQLEKLQEISGNWFDRARREASLASELAIKLMAARSAPEVASAYHDRETSHMDRAAEDAKRILTNAQGLAESGRQFLSEAPA
jgi:hypothetical protein